MKIFRYFLISLTLISTGAYAQSNFPACQGRDISKWSYCFGAATYTNDDKYVGEFKDGKRNGQGTYTFASGDKYVGDWMDGKYNGQGTLYASNGDKFVGEYKDDKRNGQGTYTYASGTKYVGEYKDNKYNGQGTYTFANGDKYVGEYKDGKHNGQGTFTFADGYKYVGEWKDDRRNGLGTLYASNGSIINQGIWADGNLIQHALIPSISDEEKFQKLFIQAFIENKNLIWTERIVKTVSTLLRSWLEDGGFIIVEIPPPTFPPALKLSQDKWESNKEFEDRVSSSRIERQKEIERIQADYKAKVDRRNSDIQKLASQRAEKEKQLPARKKELINQALAYINLQVAPKTATFDPERAILYVDASIDGGKVERFEYKNAPIQVRREAITSVGSLKMTPEFFITDSGQFGIKAINIESGGVKVAGTPTQTDAGSQTLRLATIDVPVTSMPALTQQSAMTVDRNQVEQILYRDENESLRKRLEEQRKAQELALAEETRKASAETAKLRAEADTAKNRQRELELQLASTSRTPINYGRALNAHALVIGNAAYGGSSKLPNPINDAKSMSDKLRGLDFTVTETLDADRTKLVNSLSQFSRTAVNADITLLFYAGHGVQITGTNYMLPIDLNLNDLAQAPLQGISLNDVVEKYLPGKTKLVFLDACRDNPLMQVASRGVSRGLAPINVSEGTLISYATKDGSVAQDGDGKNSPFTTALLEHIGDPDDIAVVLRKVREKVMKNTNNKQQPWEYGSLTGGALVLSAIKVVNNNNEQQKIELTNEQPRQENRQRIQALGAGSPNPAENFAIRSSGPTPSYGGRIRAKIKPNIVFTEEIIGNGSTEIEVRQAPDGTILSAKIITFSGNKSWDEAVLKATIKSEKLPPDIDGRVHSPLIIGFRPRE